MYYNIWENQYNKVTAVYRKQNWTYAINNNVDSNLCVIYFSSNNIWFPNTEEAFDRSFIENDYYEWKKIRVKNAQKEIFVRDVYKQWYVTGINQNVNSVDRVYELLKVETSGMRVVTIGSSAGGYMAVLMGSLLKAEYVLCFSAQFNIGVEESIHKSPFLSKYENDKQKAKYFDLIPWIQKAEISVYYMMPAYCDNDIKQCTYVEKLPSVHVMKMMTRHHGIPILKHNLHKLINMKEQELEILFAKNENKIVNPVVFSIQIDGLKKTMMELVNMIIKHLKK